MSEARRLLNMCESTFEKSGADFDVLYHGGPKLIRQVDPSRLQSRDSGLYGTGFYLTEHPKLANGYGSRITKVRLKPNARVLALPSYNPKDADPELRRQVYDFIVAENAEKFARMGEPSERLEKLKKIVSDVVNGDHHNIWLGYIDRFAVAKGFDVVYYGPCEIVVKNLNAIELINRTPRKKVTESAPLTREEFNNNWNTGRILMPVKVLRDRALLRPDELGYRDSSLPPYKRVGVSAAPIRDMAKIKELIRHGINNPIALNVTRDGKLEIVDGTHRLLAAEELGWDMVPVQFVPNAVDNGNGYLFAAKHGAVLSNEDIRGKS